MTRRLLSRINIPPTSTALALLVLSAMVAVPIDAVPAVASPAAASAVSIGSPATAAHRGHNALRWRPCYPEEGTFDCAKLWVPLDYDRPGRGRISVALIRQRALDPGQRIGSIVLNPGGPGGSGVDFVRFAGPFLFTDDVRARFDLVGFDPRGIFRSRQLRCFRNESQWEPYFTPFAFPISRAEIAQWIKADGYLRRACDRRAGPIIDHMATADVARDMDRLRLALGERKLNYVGYSYGSYLGVTYANLFPHRFRTLVVDGVLDPVQWATGTGEDGETVPFSTRLASHVGARATLDEFFRLCDEAGPSTCAFAPDSSDRFDALADRLRQSPAEVVDPETGETFEYNYSFLIGDTLNYLYDSPSWPDLAGFLAFLEASVDPVATGAALHALRQHLSLDVMDPTYRNDVEGFPGVACSDTDNPGRYRAWINAAVAADGSSYFGRLWTWVSSICAKWSGQDRDRYVGPFTAATASPVLVVGNRFDPATPYQGAVSVAGLMPNSRLLTVNGWGHTSLGLSACADQAVAHYLINRVLPPAGTVCSQDISPFAVSAAAATATGSEAARIVRLINLPAAGRG